jgi:four helix bundle protein
MLNLGHKKLEVWKMSVDFVTDIYALTEKFPKTEIYGIINQLRRAAVSVSLNIAEGASRSSGIERKRFYQLARSSLVEIDTQLEISIGLGYCSGENIVSLGEKLNHLFAMISKLMKKTK